jgi:Zn-dependent protease
LVRRIKTKKSVRWAAGATGAFLLTKLKALLPLFQLGKTGGAILSAGVAIMLYAWMYHWQFALGVVAMVLTHELGHVLAARQKGITVTAPFFIPFVGALIMLKRNPRDAATEAYIALGGPIIGTAGAMVSFLLGWFTDHFLFFAIAYVGFTLNLINMLPIHPLDGGRIAGTVSRWLWAAGLVGGLFAVLYLKSLLLLLFWALFAGDLLYRAFRGKGKSRRYTVWGKLEIPFDDITKDNWMVEPFPESEPIPYTTYSDLDGQQWVVLQWPYSRVRKKVKMPEQGIIVRAMSTKIERQWRTAQKKVVVRYEIDYEPYENDNYFDVPRQARWKFAAAYGGLTLFIVFMMYVVQGILAHENGFSGCCSFPFFYFFV